MTIWEIQELVEQHKPVLCNCGHALFASRATAVEGYIRMRCHHCDTDVMLAKRLLDFSQIEGRHAYTRQVVLDVAEQAGIKSITSESLSVDENALIYALWQLAKAVMYRNEDGSYDSGAVGAYGDALYLLARERLFKIEWAIGRQVEGRFVNSSLWAMTFDLERKANPEPYERVDRALERYQNRENEPDPSAG